MSSSNSTLPLLTQSVIMSESTIFEDSENLQDSIGKAIAGKKSLLCFVTDNSGDSKQWEDALLNHDIREKLLQTSVAVRLAAGSEQAGFLNAVCAIKATPAVIVIRDAQVVANLQYGASSYLQLLEYLSKTCGEADVSEPTATSSAPRPSKANHFELPPSSGRMRLPNNAYDQFRDLSEQQKANGIKGIKLLKLQLRFLASLDTPGQPSFVPSIRDYGGSHPTLVDSITNRLLNTPASRLKTALHPSTTSESSWAFPAQSSHSSPSTNTQVSGLSTTSDDRLPQPSSSTNTRAPDVSATNATPSSTGRTQSSSMQTQRASYVESKKAAEAERMRVKAQIEADRKARREAERKDREVAEADRRRKELLELRKANSTTANPKASDIRIQVRTFDGSTIRTTFPAESTISTDVRPWIDGQVLKKNNSSQPYNLKLVLTPLPNRSIEAGEEDFNLSDIDGVRGSATLIMVPVQGFVESYSDNAGGVVQGIVGTGVSLVSTAAGMAFGAFGRLLGSGTPPSPAPPNSAQQAPLQQGQTLGSSTSSGNVKVRTLADQRRDEHDEQQKAGSLYNGMGLNVQPRKDEDKRD